MCIDDVSSGMELYRDCPDDCSYFTKARTTEKTENKVDTRALLLCFFFFNAHQQTEFYSLTRFILESVLKRADFDVNKVYVFYHNVAEMRL